MKRRTTGFVSALVVCACVWAFAWACVVWRKSYLPGTRAVPSTLAMQNTLAQRIPALSFDAVGLSDVLDFYRDVSGANLQTDWTAAARVGVDPNDPVSSKLRSVLLGEALVSILSNSKLDFHTRENTILVHPAGQTPRPWRLQRGPEHGRYAGATQAWIPSLGFNRAPLRDVLKDFARTRGVPIEVDWQSLAGLGVTKDTPVHFRASNSSFTSDLSKLLAMCTDRGDIQFEVRDEGILIATREEFDRREGPPPRWWKSIGVIIGAASAMAVLILLLAWRGGGGRFQTVGPVLRRISPFAVLFIAVGAAFLTWRHGPPVWEFVREPTRWTLTADRGALHLYSTPADPATAYYKPPGKGNAGVGVLTVKGRGGFYVRRRTWPMEMWNLQVPVWAVAAVTATGPLAWLAGAFRRRRLHTEGKCRQCGYDLRASPERCPECGAAIPS